MFCPCKPPAEHTTLVANHDALNYSYFITMQPHKFQNLQDLRMMTGSRMLTSRFSLGLYMSPMVHHVRGTTMRIEFAHVALNGGTDYGIDGSDEPRRPSATAGPVRRHAIALSMGRKGPRHPRSSARSPTAACSSASTATAAPTTSMPSSLSPSPASHCASSRPVSRYRR